MPYLLRIGDEDPSPTKGCGENGCSLSEIAPTDVYCRTHDRFLPLASSAHTNHRRIMISLLALTLCAAFYFTGQLGSPLPALDAAIVIGAMALVLPLRRYRVTWPVVLVSWIVASVTMFLLVHASTVTLQWARLVSAVLLLAVATWYVIRRVWAEADLFRLEPAVAAVPAAIGVACLASYTAVRVNPLHLLPEVPSGVRTALLAIAAGMWLFALLTAIVLGAVEGAPTPVTPVEPLLGRRSAPVRKIPSGGLVGQIGTTFENVAWYVAYVLAQAGVMATNLAWFTLIVCVRRIRITIQHTWRLIVEAWEAAFWAAGTACRVVLLPALFLATAGWLAVVFANSLTDYLVDGTVRSLASLGAAALLANVALFVTWASLSYRSPRQGAAAAWRSAARTIRITMPYWLLMQAGGGWLVGLPAMLGYGRVHVGWVTYTATTVIVVTLVLHLLRRGGAVPEASKTTAGAGRVGATSSGASQRRGSWRSYAAPTDAVGGTQ